MTDFFALLDQPRAAWLDLERLKEIFHRKTLEQHPDSGSAAEKGFEELNEAYQVLQDPKRRLHHLLALANRAPSPHQPVPPELQEVFLEIGALNQVTTKLLEKRRAASNPLSKSLLQGDILAAQKKVHALSDKVRELKIAAEQRLRLTDVAEIEAISLLYQRFAYLGRWSSQLDELAFQLAS